ncbi:hypothetical protein [Parvularcula maris]|uniref:Terminase n=1 Tax=Parvularcula maris TaxID=2965077 RepID=A0A9X2LB52_9PROT|nr:hypothetical protein [Parvularcula maris]MCQ8186432.1 hypothetical protein [Parvularcula maris]
MVQRTPVEQREAKELFLSQLALTGSVAEACRRSQLSRSVVYHWRTTDKAVAEAWEQSIAIRLDAIRDEVVEKALVATGRIVEEALIGEDGMPVWDEELGDFVTVRKLVDYDPQILKSLVNKTMVSADGRNAPSVTVNTQLNVQAQQRPEVIRRVERPSWAPRAGEDDVLDAEPVRAADAATTELDEEDE